MTKSHPTFTEALELVRKQLWAQERVTSYGSSAGGRDGKSPEGLRGAANRGRLLCSVIRPKLPACWKNSSMFPSELHSRAQSPAFAAFRPCFALIAIPFRSRDRSDNDFFNKLSSLGPQ